MFIKSCNVYIKKRVNQVAGSINKIILVGNLGKDPEIRHTQTGSKIASFSVATSESWQDKTTNERRDNTQWHRIVVFNENLADIVEKYVKKGNKVYVEGSLQYRKYTDTNGVERNISEIVLSRFRGEMQILDSKSDRANNSNFNNQDKEKSISNNDENSNYESNNTVNDLDDDIPF